LTDLSEGQITKAVKTLLAQVSCFLERWHHSSLLKNIWGQAGEFKLAVSLPLKLQKCSFACFTIFILSNNNPQYDKNAENCCLDPTLRKCNG